MSNSKSRLAAAQFARNLADFRYREVMMALSTLLVVVGAIVLFPGADHVTDGVQTNLSTNLIVLFVVVAVVAGAIKGMSGFGYALIATPIFASVIDPTVAVAVLAVPPWMLNAFQIGETDTGLDFVREEWLLILVAVIGAVIGVSVLATTKTGPVVPFFIGLVLLGYVVYQVVGGFVPIERAHHPVGLGAAGFLEGFLLAVSNLGPLLPAYFHTFERDTERYIGGLSMVLGAVFTVRIIQMYFFTDLLTTNQLWLGCVISVITLVGLFVGTYLRRLEFDQQKFNWFVVALLFVISLNIFRKAGPAAFAQIRATLGF